MPCVLLTDVRTLIKKKGEKKLLSYTQALCRHSLMQTIFQGYSYIQIGWSFSFWLVFFFLLIFHRLENFMHSKNILILTCGQRLLGGSKTRLTLWWTLCSCIFCGAGHEDHSHLAFHVLTCVWPSFPPCLIVKTCNGHFSSDLLMCLQASHIYSK